MGGGSTEHDRERERALSGHEDEHRTGIVENAGAPVAGEEREAVHDAGLGGGTGDLGGGGDLGGDPVGRGEDADPAENRP
jgi:hypothetical protein